MKQPIGIFDSGVGGLTVTRALRERLPHEDLLYFGDTAHLPYGEKSPEAIRTYSKGISKFLLERGAKAIVIACNSASSVATDVLIDLLGPEIPVINVIDPIVAAVSENTKNIGIIGTRATIKSGVYQAKLKAAHPQLTVSALATPLFVPIIEEGLESSEISYNTTQHYLSLPEIKNIDTLVPGCTHYPLLISQFQKVLGPDVSILNTPNIVASFVHRVLSDRKMLISSQHKGESEFFVSDFTPTFERIAKHFFGTDIRLEESDIWNS